MRVHRAKGLRYLRADNGTEVPKNKRGLRRREKFSEMQKAGDFYDYVYSLPNVQSAIKKYNLTSENELPYPPESPQFQEYVNKMTETGDLSVDAPRYNAPRVREEDIDFMLDQESVGPLPEGAQAIYYSFGLGKDKYGSAGRRLERYRDKYTGPVDEKRVVEELKEMYPNEPKESFETAEGIAGLMAKRARDRFTYSQNFTTDNPYGDEVYGEVIPSNSAGTKEKPFMMGMASVQKRGRDSVMMSPDAPKETTVHEMSHTGDFKTGTQAKYIRSLVDWDRARGESNYMFEPTEVRARLMEVRENLYNNGVRDPKDTYTAEDLSKVTGDVMGLSYLRRVYTDKAIAELLNNAY